MHCRGEGENMKMIYLQVFAKTETKSMCYIVNRSQCGLPFICVSHYHYRWHTHPGGYGGEWVSVWEMCSVKCWRAKLRITGVLAEWNLSQILCFLSSPLVERGQSHTHKRSLYQYFFSSKPEANQPKVKQSVSRSNST